MNIPENMKNITDLASQLVKEESSAVNPILHQENLFVNKGWQCPICGRVYSPIEIAKKLKSIGFPQINYGQYTMLCACYIDDGRFYNNGCIINIDDAYTAPTISELFKWLREEKGVYVSIETFPTFSTKNKVHFCYTIKTESDGSNMKVIESEHTYCEYSEAELNCIEYIIDNILQIKQK